MGRRDHNGQPDSTGPHDHNRQPAGTGGGVTLTCAAFHQTGRDRRRMDAAKVAGLEPHIVVGKVAGQPCQEVLA